MSTRYKMNLEWNSIFLTDLTDIEVSSQPAPPLALAAKESFKKR